MHKEYAVEPEAIGASWEDFRFLIEYFGYSRGRLISKFPRNWSREVIDAARAAGVPDIAYSKIVERLKNRNRDVLIKTGRAYDSSSTWIENAIRSNEISAFHAILAAKAGESENCTCVSDVDETNPLMSSPISVQVERTPTSIALCCQLLISQAKEVDIVDPFFDIRDKGEGGRRFAGDDFKGTLLEIIANCEAYGNTNKLIRIHYREHDERPSQQSILEDAEQWISEKIPEGFKIHLMGWKEIEDGEDYHDRFVLTDFGGLKIGAGFGATSENQNANVARLDEIHANQLKEQFSESSLVYERVGFTVSISANGTEKI